ncbi:nitroreductase family protein [Desulfohalobiaceae bacterium Ax17]|uniref:nitroreductase family protein n=1 Tax=Desulfovulcanus ferrireducens TaxID=2831190 RepID=UPI00207BB5CD|nr:nitroreductase family protein [Desulfovulcanus ferrireducens]MBT8764342.1 nitroreductase family protein [Desulfovulcanus ferrireducens]
MTVDIFDAIFNRRSIRKFTEQDVDREKIIKILDAGRWAPSGLNNQPWRFLVVKDEQRKAKLAECTRYGHIVRQANTLIVVFLAKDAMYNATKDYQGAGACIQNMLLAAHGLGLGAVWLGEILNQETQVHEVLNTDPEQLELMAVIAMGYPAQEGSSSRKDLSQLLLEEF